MINHKLIGYIVVMLGVLSACNRVDGETQTYPLTSSTNTPFVSMPLNQSTLIRPLPTRVPTMAPMATVPPHFSPTTPLEAKLPMLESMLSLPTGTIEVAFSPDSSLLALAITGAEVSIINSSDGSFFWTAPNDKIASYTWSECGKEPLGHAVAFSHDGSKLAIANSCGGIFLFDLANRRVIGKTSHPEVVLDLVFSRDDQYVVAVSCGEAGGLTIWDWMNDHATNKILSGMCLLTESPEPSVVIVGYGLLRFDLKSQQVIEPALIPDNNPGSMSVAYSPNERVVAAEVNGQLRLHDLKTKMDVPWDGWQSYQTEIVGVAWSAQNVLALADYTGLVVLWDMDLKQPLGKIQVQSPDFSSNPLAFSPDGNYLVTVFANSPSIWKVGP